LCIIFFPYELYIDFLGLIWYSLSSMKNIQEGEKQQICSYSGKNDNCTERKSAISCFNRIAGTLTGEEILLHKIINIDLEDYGGINENIHPTTYDLRLGDAHYVFDHNEEMSNSTWNQIFIGTNENLIRLNQVGPKFESKNDGLKILEIPPFGSALIQFEEIVDTLTVARTKNILVVGRFDLKLSEVNKALISQQAAQVEPCYKGKLFCFLHNFSNEAVRLKHQDSIATIEFSYVSCFCGDEKRREIITDLIKANQNRYRKQDYIFEDSGIDDVRWFNREDQLPSGCGLTSINRVLQREIDNFRKWKESIDSVYDDKFNAHIKNVDNIDKLTTTIEKRSMIKWRTLTAIIALITTIITSLGFSFLNELRQNATPMNLRSGSFEMETENTEAYSLQENSIGEFNIE